MQILKAKTCIICIFLSNNIYGDNMNTNLNLTPKEYDNLISKIAKKSNLVKDIFFAFLIGGLICCLGQLIMNTALNHNIEKDIASSITCISLIFIAAFLTGINLFSRIGNLAGAGTMIPITGFSNSIVSPAIEFKSEGFVTGLGVNMFKVAGPVIVYGTTATVICGFIYYIINYIL